MIWCSGCRNRRRRRRRPSILSSGDEGQWTGTPFIVTDRNGGEASGFDYPRHVTFAHDPAIDIDGENFTIDFWIKGSNYFGLFGGVPIVDKRQSMGFLIFSYRGKLALQLKDGAGYSNYVSGTRIDTGEWTFIAVSVDRTAPNAGQMYVNGQSIHSFDASSRGGSLSNTADLTIGYSPLDNRNSGNFEIDDLEITKAALTHPEVLALYQMPKCAIGAEFDIEVDSRFHHLYPDYRRFFQVHRVTNKNMSKEIPAGSIIELQLDIPGRHRLFQQHTVPRNATQNSGFAGLVDPAERWQCEPPYNAHPRFPRGERPPVGPSELICRYTATNPIAPGDGPPLLRTQTDGGWPEEYCASTMFYLPGVAAPQSETNAQNNTVCVYNPALLAPSDYDLSVNLTRVVQGPQRSIHIFNPKITVGGQTGILIVRSRRRFCALRRL